MATKLFAYLSYRDASRALEWLTAIGFTVVRRESGEGDIIIHAELRAGDAVVMVASNDEPYQHPPLLGRSTGQGLYLFVDDVAAKFAHAVAAGAQAVLKPERTEWGSERARVLDFEGYEWSFGTYEPGTEW